MSISPVIMCRHPKIIMSGTEQVGWHVQSSVHHHTNTTKDLSAQQEVARVVARGTGNDAYSARGHCRKWTLVTNPLSGKFKHSLASVPDADEMALHKKRKETAKI